MGFPIKHKSQYILEAIRMAVACEETADRLTYLAHRALNKGEHEAYNRLISEATTARIEADRYQRKAVELAFILKQEVDSAK